MVITEHYVYRTYKEKEEEERIERYCDPIGRLKKLKFSKEEKKILQDFYKSKGVTCGKDLKFAFREYLKQKEKKKNGNTRKRTS